MRHVRRGRKSECLLLEMLLLYLIDVCVLPAVRAVIISQIACVASSHILQLKLLFSPDNGVEYALQLSFS